MKHLVGGKTELYFYSRLISAHSSHILAFTKIKKMAEMTAVISMIYSMCSADRHACLVSNIKM